MLESFNAKCHWKDDTAKGQLISKGLFDVTVSTKKQTFFLRISALASKKRSNQKNKGFFITWISLNRGYLP